MLTTACYTTLQFTYASKSEIVFVRPPDPKSWTFVSISWLRACTRQNNPSAACSGRCIVGPPIMTALTPSPDISPVSAATTNGFFPQDSFCLSLSTLPDASSFMFKSALRSPHLLESPNGLFFGSVGLSNSYRKRPRNMSQSSGTDREMSTNSTPPATNQVGSIASTRTMSNGTSSEQRPPTKKRPSTDTIDYPRRRATIAVLQHMSMYMFNTN